MSLNKIMAQNEIPSKALVTLLLTKEDLPPEIVNLYSKSSTSTVVLYVGAPSSSELVILNLPHLSITLRSTINGNLYGSSMLGVIKRFFTLNRNMRPAWINFSAQHSWAPPSVVFFAFILRNFIENYPFRVDWSVISPSGHLGSEIRKVRGLTRTVIWGVKDNKHLYLFQSISHTFAMNSPRVAIILPFEKNEKLISLFKILLALFIATEDTFVSNTYYDWKEVENFVKELQ